MEWPERVKAMLVQCVAAGSRQREAKLVRATSLLQQLPPVLAYTGLYTELLVQCNKMVVLE